jgi:hypothetical protein
VDAYIRAVQLTSELLEVDIDIDAA